MNVTDCKGNAVGVQNKTSLGLPKEAMPSDVVINEILFDPKTNGNDYVELYNRSTAIIDISGLHLANRNTAGTISSVKRLSEMPFYLFPGNYAVFTEDAAALELGYFVKNREAVFEIASLPSFPDDEGIVVLLKGQGVVIDEVRYSDDWHFGLIANKDGVSLERLDPDGPSQDANNWHSAASTAGYGTPGYINSQYKQPSAVNAFIEILPKVFSPDGDGFDDLLTINYNIAESGYVANIIIFDAAGRQVRHLVKNSLLGLKGFWTWDGLGEQRQKLPVGSYIIYTEFFNLEGKKERFKNVVVLGRKLN